MIGAAIILAGSVLASTVASLAMVAQPQELPGSFTRCIERRGEPVVSATFLGIECKARDGETVYAGLADGRLVTGP